MALLIETARAKVNLTLRVLGKRPDGYHEIESLVAFAEAGDEISLDVAKPAGLCVAGPYGTSIAGPNLLMRTVELLQQKHPKLRLGHAQLQKQLPVASGLGGGSADAAALLRAIRRANPDLADDVDWRSLAAGLGADVPVCLHNRACWMSGIGERLHELSTPFPPLNAVLVNPMVPVPHDKTAQVFRRLGAGALSPRSTSTFPTSLATRDDVIGCVRTIGNDLTAAAMEVAPQIRENLGALVAQEACEVAQLSGAGPSCFGIFATEAAATRAEQRLRASHPDWWTVQTTLA